MSMSQLTVSKTMTIPAETSGKDCGDTAQQQHAHEFYAREDAQETCLGESVVGSVAEHHDTCRGSMPSFFMRAISVVRLRPIRVAAPSAPATRP
jgi:hypothetical protein